MTKLSELRELRKSLLSSNGSLSELQNFLGKLESLNLDGLDGLEDVFANSGVVDADLARDSIQNRIKKYADEGYFGYVESLCYDLKMLDDYPDERFWIINEYRRLERLNEAAVEDILDELIDSRK